MEPILHRYLPDIREQAADVTTPACHYKPIFGAGDPGSGVIRGVARFGEITVDAGGASKPVSYAAEEQVYVILEGSGVLSYGDEKFPVRTNDFMYLPPGVKHGIAGACRLIVMGFKIPQGEDIAPPPKALIANADDVQKQVVGNHPPSTLYQLLMGDRKSTRDRIAAAHVLTSLFVMEFAPGGTNTPHHHAGEEEIYLVLNGHGEMVAGEGRYPAKAGDAYFFAPNSTVGFYSGNKEGKEKAHILAVRSRFPGLNTQSIRDVPRRIR